MSIQDFIGRFAGGARPNRFRVQITWPAAVGTPNVEDEIVVNAAQMPSSVVGTILVPYKGRQIPVPGDRTFEEWTCNIMNDLSYSHRNALERWSNLINSHEGNIQGVDSYKALLGVIDVTQLDLQDRPIKTVKLLNAFPTNIVAIDLGYNNNDTISEFQCSFAYTSWQSTTTS